MTEGTDERDILQARRSKRTAWIEETGGYANDFSRSHTSAQLLALCGEKDKAELESEAIPTSVCGRIVLRRVMGKASFITLQDAAGQIQCYLSKNDLADVYASSPARRI